MSADIPGRLLIAIGGNAIHPEGIRGTPAEQSQEAAALGRALLPLMELGTELVITHGNGPVVGKILLRNTLARHRVAPMTLDICVAHSQGGVAYMLMQALENTLRAAGSQREVACLLTQVEVDPDDPAFANPTLLASAGSFAAPNRSRMMTTRASRCQPVKPPSMRVSSGLGISPSLPAGPAAGLRRTGRALPRPTRRPRDARRRD